MARMTLREAAERTSRSITTLRRYIRSGKLQAELRDGRYGPEYFVGEEELMAAGLDASAYVDDRDVDGQGDSRALARIVQDSVPLRLYQELQMKHEQLLVQYGMVRAAGLRAVETRERQAETERRLEAALRENSELRARLKHAPEPLTRRLREAELELEGKRLEIDALGEKVRALEMLTRNSITNETVERRFSALMEQARRVRKLSTPRVAPRDRGADEPDH